MIGEVDLSTNPKKIEIYLCKPNLSRTTIAKITEANITRLVDNYKFNTITYKKNYKFAHVKNYKITYGNINELSLEIPLKVDYDGVLTDNPHFNLIRERYLLKVINNNITEYFIISKIEKSANNDLEVKNISAYSLGYELSDKIIVKFDYESKNANEILTLALSSTVWSVGYIDSEFLLKYRQFSFNEITVLNMVFEIATIFNAVVSFDTTQRTISFYKQENLGLNKGLVINAGKYLDSINYEYDFSNYCTRLKIFGKDQISINSINPPGTNYIENFYLFLGSFKQDEQGNVIIHSEYMSDSLAIALKSYNKLIEIKEGEFNNLLSNLELTQGILTTKQNELTNLENELAILKDNLDIANAKGQSTTNILEYILIKETEINNKNDEISIINVEIINIQNQINNLSNQLKQENNFSEEQIKELNQFIIEKVYTNDAINDPKDLLEMGKQYFKELTTPPINMKINIVNFLEMMEFQYEWDKLEIGNIVTIKHSRMGINVQAKIIDIEFDFESSDINLTISNVKDILTAEQKFIKSLNDTINTSASLNLNSYKWNQAVATADDVSQIINNMWDATLRQIQGGVNESVDISRRGIIIKDPTDPLRYLVAQHGVLALTNDGGNTWKHAIRPDGIIAERLIGKILLGNLLYITDDRGQFKIEGNLLTIKDSTGIIRALLGNYATDKYGLKLLSKDGKVTILDEDGILQTWQEGRTDNVDSSNPLILYIYIPSETLSIHKAILRFKRLSFRSYSKSASSGGGSTQTSTSGGSINTTTNSGGGSYQTSSVQILKPGISQDYTTGAGSHNHGISDGTQLATAAGGAVTWSSLGNHNHNLYNHGHETDIPLHTHDISIEGHTHSVSIPSHVHGIIYGIYTNSIANGITIKINGVDRTIELGGSFNIDKSNLDIKKYLIIGQWNSIELGANSLGRIDSSIFLQVLMGI